MCAARGDLSKRVYEKAASASADVQLSVAVQKNTSWRANFEAASLRRSVNVYVFQAIAHNTLQDPAQSYSERAVRIGKLECFAFLATFAQEIHVQRPGRCFSLARSSKATRRLKNYLA